MITRSVVDHNKSLPSFKENDEIDKNQLSSMNDHVNQQPIINTIINNQAFSIPSSSTCSSNNNFTTNANHSRFFETVNSRQNNFQRTSEKCKIKNVNPEKRKHKPSAEGKLITSDNNIQKPLREEAKQEEHLKDKIIIRKIEENLNNKMGAYRETNKDLLKIGTIDEVNKKKRKEREEHASFDATVMKMFNSIPLIEEMNQQQEEINKQIITNIEKIKKSKTIEKNEVVSSSYLRYLESTTTIKENEESSCGFDLNPEDLYEASIRKCKQNYLKKLENVISPQGNVSIKCVEHEGRNGEISLVNSSVLQCKLSKSIVDKYLDVIVGQSIRDECSEKLNEKDKQMIKLIERNPLNECLLELLDTSQIK
ncbi:hypothetical protein ABK040_008196 [Willaertia magna]